MEGPSSHGTNKASQLLISRLIRYNEILEGLAQEVESIKLPSASANVLKYVAMTARLLIKDVSRIADLMLPNIESQKELLDRFKTISSSIGIFIYFVENYILQSRGIPRSFYQLTELIRSELPEEWKFNYLACKGTSLGVLPINKYLMKILKSFLITRKEIANYPPLWLFIAPSSILRSPLEWSLVAHEIGHIIEKNNLRVLSRQYPDYKDTDTPLSTAKIRYEYAGELQADFIGAYFFGLSFIRQAIEEYYEDEQSLSLSHPSWGERVNVLVQHGLPNLPATDKCRDLLENYIGDLRLDPGLIRISESEVHTLISKTKEILNDSRIPPFDCGCKEFNDACEKLRQFLPYAKDYRVLLNGAILEQDNAISYYVTNKLGDEDKRFKEYDYLIQDCLRLCYIKMNQRILFETREAEEEMIASQEQGA